MKKALISLIIILTPALLRPQGLKVGIQSGLEFSGMSDLRVLNVQFKNAVPFSTKLVADFPGYWYYQPMLKFSSAKFGLGLEYSFNSTGSRISGKDYSGEYRLDMRISKKSPGLSVEYFLFAEKNFGFWLYTGGGVMFTSLRREESLVVNDIYDINDSAGFRSTNYYIQPGFKVTWPWNSLEFEFYSAYLIQLGKGTLRNEQYKNEVLANMVTGDPVKPGWNGIKLGIAVDYILIKSK
jgi:hypothetical protein